MRQFDSREHMNSLPEDDVETKAVRQRAGPLSFQIGMR